MSKKQVMNKTEVAIVGGAGFVGSRLTARFGKRNVFSNKYDINLRISDFLKVRSVFQ